MTAIDAAGGSHSITPWPGPRHFPTARTAAGELLGTREAPSSRRCCRLRDARRAALLSPRAVAASLAALGPVPVVGSEAWEGSCAGTARVCFAPPPFRCSTSTTCRATGDAVERDRFGDGPTGRRVVVLIDPRARHRCCVGSGALRCSDVLSTRRERIIGSLPPSNALVVQARTGGDCWRNLEMKVAALLRPFSGKLVERP